MEFLISELRAARVLDAQADLDAKTVLGEPPAYVGYKHPVHASYHAQLTETEVVVDGKADTTLSLTCSRCLEEFDRPVDVRFQQVFDPGLEKIDVVPEVREAILLDLPLSAACKDDCAGICAGCGANLNRIKCKCADVNTDPRWAGLKQLKLK